LLKMERIKMNLSWPSRQMVP